MCAGSDMMKVPGRRRRRNGRQIQLRDNYSAAMTQATVSRYVIVILLLGNMTPLLHTLPQVTLRSLPVTHKILTDRLTILSVLLSLLAIYLSIHCY